MTRPLAVSAEATKGDTVRLAPVMIQPMAAEDVATAVANVAMGPEQIRLNALIERGLRAINDTRKVIADPHAATLGRGEPGRGGSGIVVGVRRLVSAALLVMTLAGCVELGVVSDGTSLSVGKSSRGYLVDGARLPDQGDGWLTREVWKARGNRYGTDELVDLIIGVARRMRSRVHDVQLVVADLSGKGGGEKVAFHRSHQSGRDADLLYYMRDAKGHPFEPDAMHVFDARGQAVDGSGIVLDVPRTWQLVREIITAPEAPVQWIFVYEPLAKKLLEHAEKIGEPAPLRARARATLKQPGDSARHDDHLHVRVYCSTADKAYGCVDFGSMELLAEHEASPLDGTALDPTAAWGQVGRRLRSRALRCGPGRACALGL